MLNAGIAVAESTRDQAVEDAFNTYEASVDSSVNNHNIAAANLNDVYNTSIATAESTLSSTLAAIQSNLDTQLNTVNQNAISQLGIAESDYDASIAQANVNYSGLGTSQSSSGSGSGSTSSSGSSSGSGSSSSSAGGSSSGSSSSSTSTSGSGSSSSSGSGSSSNSTSGSASSSGSSSGSANGNVFSLPDYLTNAVNIAADGTYSVNITGDTYIDSAASNWIDYQNGLSVALTTYSDAISSNQSNKEAAAKSNLLTFATSIVSAASSLKSSVDTANGQYSSSLISSFDSYVSDINNSTTNYNNKTEKAYGVWEKRSITAGKTYISTVNSVWGTYQTAVVQAAIDAKGQMEQAIFAYQDWYENTPQEDIYGWSGMPSGWTSPLPGKQHGLAVEIATINLDLQTKYANALYTYTVAEWDAWLTFFTETKKIDTDYVIALNTAESEYSTDLTNATSSYNHNLIEIDKTYKNAIVNAQSAYAIDLASAADGYIHSQIQTDSNFDKANQNANLAKMQTDNNFNSDYLNSETEDWFIDFRNNSSMSTDQLNDSYEHETWETSVTSAGNSLLNTMASISVGLNNSIIDLMAGTAGSISSANTVYENSITNANRDFDSGSVTITASLSNGVISAASNLTNSLTSTDSTFKNTVTTLWTGFQIGVANIGASIGKHAAVKARDEKIKTAKDHLETVTNESSSSDYLLDGNNYYNAFDFVPEAYYYASGLYLDFGIPSGSIIEEVQDWVDSLEGGNVSNSNSSSSSGSGTSSSSGNVSASGSTSGSSSSSGSPSGSGNGSTSGSGSTSSSGVDELTANEKAMLIDELYKAMGRIKELTETINKEDLDRHTGIISLEKTLPQKVHEQELEIWKERERNIQEQLGNTNLPIQGSRPDNMAWSNGFFGSLGDSWSSMQDAWSGIILDTFYDDEEFDSVAQQFYNQAYDLGPLGQTADSSGISYYGTRGALGVATVATAVASTVLVLQAAGSATMTVSIVEEQGGAHVVYGVTTRGVTTFQHWATGGVGITGYPAGWAAEAGYFSTMSGIPVFFPEALLGSVVGESCYGAAWYAFLAGLGL
tara:strand:- start:1724 stop:4921 length:3198 start_codon:yes stop_codon:yes gene_type:complete